MTCSICIISTKSPYRGHSAKEALDTVMTSLSYHIPTNLLLMGDGVYQIVAAQSPEQLPRKNLTALFKSLALYGIDKVYVDEAAMTERNLNAEQLLPNHKILTTLQLRTLLNKHNKIMSF
ncbi:MAG: sulfurtransferase complex subunit TusC [Candidatus Endonucleobacter bathymodioli]|uniref:Sulfurtransferase complex subunit TusC n=1 Tax=Candidatus Endonucleibacter bathymodioli TaxID=539814 RepID=A0AA90NJN6_9GAMM|nr:sulfurtransferase complex subunit TusC [Candidatus Endonucleobacter bathymodioli]